MIQHMESKIEDYWIQAKKIIFKYGKQPSPSDDFISYIAHHIMLADWRFDPQNFDNKIGTFRLSYAKNAIKMYYRQRNTKSNSMSNFDPLSEVGMNIVPDYSDLDQADNELIDIILHKIRSLPSREQTIMFGLVFEKRTLASLAKELSLTKQGVSYIYETTINQIQELVPA